MSDDGPLFLTMDVETYFDDEYSLRKMMMAHYIRDPRFKAHGWAVKVGAGEARWMTHDATKKFLDVVKASGRKVFLIGHNLAFDGAILAWRYGFVPDLYIDTMGMSRAVLGDKIASHSLDSVAKWFNLEGKAKGAALAAVKGVFDPSPAMLAELGCYAVDDATQTWEIFQRLRKGFPRSQYKTLDWTIRMFTEPKLVLDREILLTEYEREKSRKGGLIEALGVDKTAVVSNEQFAGLLREAGVEPPTKVSKRTGKQTYAFAKTDQAMSDLLAHEDELVRTLAEARVGVKSSILETRALKLASLADWPLSVPLQFAGAVRTKRLSGCLVSDTIICVLRGGEIADVPIVELRDTDLVWDGLEFVAHGGLVYSGLREVMEYDGITGTPEHIVFTTDGDEISLAEAAARGARIESAPRPVRDAA